LKLPFHPARSCAICKHKILAGGHGECLVVVRGGCGGCDNFVFKTPQCTAPKLAEHGEMAISCWLLIELHLLADVGFLGMPNAGTKRFVQKNPFRLLET
jgi:GTPase involved in cell partitioning and DNA repair